MSAPEISIWWLVELTGRDKLTPATTKTFKITNRMHPDATDTNAYKVLLENIRGLGNQMGLFLPAAVRGSITIDDSQDSWGYSIKFSDFFERYTFVDQAITVKQAVTEVDATAPTYATVWSGKVAKYRRVGSDDQVTFEVLSLGIVDRIMTKAINSTNFPSAPSSALGRHLPLILGTDVEVQGVLVDATLPYSAPKYALGVTLGTQYPVSSITRNYVKDFRGNYARVEFDPTGGLVLYQSTASTNSALFPTLTLENAFRIDPGTFLNFNYVVTHVVAYWRGNGGNTTTDGDLIVSIFSLKNDGTTTKPDKLVAKGSAKKSDYAASINVNADFAVTVALDKPIPLSYYSVGPNGSALEVFAISASQTNETTSTCAPSVNTAASCTQWARPAGDTEWGPSVTSYQWRFGFYGMSRTDYLAGTSTVDAEGLGHAYVTLGQRSAVSGQVSPDLTRDDWIFLVTGLKDDGSGTITGTAGAAIEGPYYQIKTLLQEWSGSSWVAGALGSLHSDSISHVIQIPTARFNRTTLGRTEGRTSRLKLIEEICRTGGCRIGSIITSSASNLFVYAWGTARTSAATITDEDALILSHEVADSSSVLNAIEMQYNRMLTGSSPNASIQDETLRKFALALDWRSSQGGLPGEYSAASEAIFGRRAIEDAEFTLLSDPVSAEHVAEMLLAENAMPEEKVELEAPYLKFRDRNLCDVIEIVHPDLPAYGGSSYEARQPYYDGATPGAADMNLGQYLKKAKLYRAMIEGRVLNWNVNEFPTLRLTARLLLNNPKDPT